MRKTLMMAALAATISMPAYAVTLKKGSPACLSEDLFSQLTTAVMQKDMDALNWLSDNGCIISAKQFHVTVLDLSNWNTVAHVRMYNGKDAIEVWTLASALEGYDLINHLASQ